MKRFFFVLPLFMLGILQQSAQAQGIHFGLKAGTNITKITGRSFSDAFQYGFAAGGFAEININKKWGLQPELLWTQSETKTATGFSDIVNNGLEGVTTTLNYLTIPVLLTYRPIPVLSLQAGPQFGLLINQSQTILYNAQDAFKKGDILVVGGAQVNLAKFKIGARYFASLTDIRNTSTASGGSDTWKNQGFQLYLGLRIF